MYSLEGKERKRERKGKEKGKEGRDEGGKEGNKLGIEGEKSLVGHPVDN